MNCLVTKLKGSVQNENLPIYGKGIIEVVVSDNTTNELHYEGKGKIEFELLEGNVDNFTYPTHITFMSKSGNKITVNKSGIHDSTDTAWAPIMFTAPGYYKIRYDKYNCKPKCNSYHTIWAGVSADDFSVYNIDLGKYGNDFYTISITSGKLEDILSKFTGKFIQEYATYGGKMYSSKVGGDISQFNNNDNIQNIDISVNSNLSGDLTSFLQHPNKDNIQTLSFANVSRLTGNLEAVLPNLPSLLLFNGENNSNYTGSLENIAQACIANGRQAGTTLTIRGNMVNVLPNPKNKGKVISFISDGQGGVTYTITDKT
jgi:hypothetical protein